ncbi:P-loop containing nucleoside triphosphate hydrolase protein [Nadsonia fulvescens var. elongata DSM 6958]|uniref:p-loop containing nucleoside triphosphate hydrolase protein n=1 Tax=Nadsonia fulvescens var. elongata DSM 6958 TaxID=857566 RepID=A0A1E3PGF9_9ASCO|nr:P-loop containing nucleoside triphosphate hydrolase protein [Nadsonia fulvescens var. elongata DSM 6958]
MATISIYSWFQSVYNYLLSLFWSTELDVTLLGLQNAGKTSLLKVFIGEEFSPDSIPTVGFAMKRVKHGHVTLKCWDLGGQPRFRSMWERYCRGVNCVVFVLDSADASTFETAKTELNALLSKEALVGIPLLVLGNKNDLPASIGTEEIINILQLEQYKDRDISVLSISVKEGKGLPGVLSWLISRKNSNK